MITSDNAGLTETVLNRYGGCLPANPIIHKSFFEKHNKTIRVPYGAKASHIPSDGNVIGEPIGVHVYLLFDLPSNTAATHAYDLFRNPAFNSALKDLQDSWGQYLTADDSASSLTDQDEGCFSKVGIARSEANNRGVFNETYVTPDPDTINRGCTSWDAFFVRENARPVNLPDNNAIIHSTCKSTVYRMSTNIKQHDHFWLKGQAYSLFDLLNHNDFSRTMVGGTVYQAFLGLQDYHRWHSPVNGTIVHVELVPGTSCGDVLPDEGAHEDDPDLQPADPHGALICSQAWLAILMCFVGVGVAEVSTCSITVQKEQVVKMGDEFGMFHLGGSSHALIFGPWTKAEFFDHVVIDTHIYANSIIANVTRA